MLCSKFSVKDSRFRAFPYRAGIRTVGPGGWWRALEGAGGWPVQRPSEMTNPTLEAGRHRLALESVGRLFLAPFQRPVPDWSGPRAAMGGERAVMSAYEHL